MEKVSKSRYDELRELIIDYGEHSRRTLKEAAKGSEDELVRIKDILAAKDFDPAHELTPVQSFRYA